MGRWSQFDTDKERLPRGMKRIGYDADSQTYTYRDADGSLWEGSPGCQYGTLYRVKPNKPLPSVTVEKSSSNDEELPPLPDDAYEFLMGSDSARKQRAKGRRKPLPLTPDRTVRSGLNEYDPPPPYERHDTKSGKSFMNM